MTQSFFPNLDDLLISVDIKTLDPAMVSVEQVPTSTIVGLQKGMSKAVWRPAPGRKLGFLVKHNASLLGILFLASPVINLGARDIALALPSDPSRKGAALRNVADLSVCVPSQPFGWRWNGGKLLAMVATTLGRYWEARYGDKLTHITTTSLWGKGSMYNRVYKFVGYTQGYGHEHITDEEYMRMISWMKRRLVPIPTGHFGEGSNLRFRVLSAYRKASGDKTHTAFHGNKRGVYVTEATAEPLMTVVARWYERWGAPRYMRKYNQQAPYTTGLGTSRIRSTD
jgi:hypothetical protein